MAHNWRKRYGEIPPERRGKIEAEVAELRRQMPLHELRRARQLSQEQLARTLGEKQASISKLEQRTDMYVSTLRRYLEAMGGELIIAVRFPAGAIEIDQFGQLEATEDPTLGRPRKARAGAKTAPASRSARTRGGPPASKLNRNAGKEWNAGEVKELRHLVRENTPTRVIGLKLGRTPGAVQTKASAEGISLKPANRAHDGQEKR